MPSQHTTTYPLPIAIDGIQYYHHKTPFTLESGAVLPSVTIAYHTYGQLNATKDNVIWVCHALTANSQVEEWWAGIFGPGKILDPDQYFIVCANILGSCYGTTCARSINPITNEAYGLDFPFFTIRDMVGAHELLRSYLGISKIAIGIGGSCGGHQIMEMAYQYPDLIDKMVLLVTSAKETAWAIAIHEAGRMTLESDPTFNDNIDKAGTLGLRSARAVGLLGYRTIQAYIDTQTDKEDRLAAFRASSYIRYQGEKLERRFYAHCYYQLLNALDAHNIGRERGGVIETLNQIKHPSLVIGIDTDMLIPTSQQWFLAEHLPNGEYKEISSKYGHDGFLIEGKKINQVFFEWMERLG